MTGNWNEWSVTLNEHEPAAQETAYFPLKNAEVDQCMLCTTDEFQQINETRKGIDPGPFPENF